LTEQLQLLLESLDRFIAGVDRSIGFAKQIEGMMLELFSDDNDFEDALHYLSLYQPGGGGYLYDQKSILPVMKAAREEIAKRLAESLGDR
jgi:hypothetical protein